MLYVFLMATLVQAAEKVELLNPKDRACHQHDIYNKGITLYKHPTLNVPSSEYITNYSSNLKLWGGKVSKVIHKISPYSNTWQNQVILEENATEKYAFVEDKICFVTNENNIQGLSFSDGQSRVTRLIPFSQQTIHRITPSKIYSGILYLFVTNKTYGKNPAYELQLFDYKNNNVRRCHPFGKSEEILRNGGCTEHYLVETANPLNYILYHRVADNAKVWRFDAMSFQQEEKLPYMNIEECVTSNTLKLVAFSHDFTKVSLCSSDDLHKRLISFDLVNHSVNCMKFINESFLAVSTSTFYCTECKRAHPTDNSLHIFDLDNNACIYRENSPFFNSKIDHIKTDYNESGEKLMDSLALFNHAHKVWFRLKFSVLVGAHKLKND